jgi:hypothetical protein
MERRSRVLRLVANFNAAPVLQPGTFSPFVRMQNVGSGGGGSLALTGSVPVGSTLPMLGLGFFGLTFWHFTAAHRHRLKRPIFVAGGGLDGLTPPDFFIFRYLIPN